MFGERDNVIPLTRVKKQGDPNITMLGRGGELNEHQPTLKEDTASRAAHAEIARLKKAHQEIASGERQRKTTNEFDEKMKKAYKAIVDSALDDTDAQMKKRA
jgi:hypothetical protein